MKKIIITLFLLVILPIVTGSTDKTPDAIAQCMIESGYTYVSLKKNLGNNYEVKAKINGGKEVTLVLNFNFSDTFLSKEVLDATGIKYKKTNRTYQINDDEEDIYKTTVDSINIGNGKTGEEEILVLDFSEFDALENSDAAGVLGNNFLVKYHAIFDYQNQRLYLKTEK